MEKGFNTEVFQSLSEENKAKVECIYNIAVIIKDTSSKPLNATDFDYLYDKPLAELDDLTNYIRTRTNMIRFDIEGE